MNYDEYGTAMVTMIKTVKILSCELLKKYFFVVFFLYEVSRNLKVSLEKKYFGRKYSKLQVLHMEIDQQYCSDEKNIPNIIESKISTYKTSSHRYHTPIIGTFVKFLQQQNEDGQKFTLDLREYGVENIQFQLIMECLMYSITTNLTSLYLKNNDFDYHCCRCMSEFVKMSDVFEILDFEQCW